MTTLETWLAEATRKLSKESAAQVRTEIQEHYDAARESAPDEHAAVAMLGDAKAANRQYRQVLLTAEEAKLLGTAKWECQVVGRRVRELPLVLLGGSAVALYFGQGRMGQMLLGAGIMMLVLLTMPSLPIYTPLRARIFRCVKWAGLVGGMALAFGPAVLELSWLMWICLWPMIWTEWKYSLIRRKLPVARWPKHLYR